MKRGCMKKILLGIGTIIAVVTPIVSVVACSNEDKDESREFHSLSTVETNYIDGQNSSGLKVLVDKYNNDKSDANYKAIMDAINIVVSQSHHNPLFTFSLSGDTLIQRSTPETSFQKITYTINPYKKDSGVPLGSNPLSTLTTSVIIEDLDSTGLGSLSTDPKIPKTITSTQSLIDALKGLVALGTIGQAVNGESEGRIYFAKSSNMLSQIGLFQSGTKQINSKVEVSSSIGEQLIHTIHNGEVKYFIDKAINGKRAFSKVSSPTTVEYLFSITMN